MAWSIRVNVFPRCSIGIRKLVGGHPDNGSIAGMEVPEPRVQLTLLHGNNVREAEASPEKRAWDLPERMYQHIVDSV